MSIQKLNIKTGLQQAPENFPFAVCTCDPTTEGEVIAWFRIERDAKVFAEAEKKTAELQIQLKAAQEKTNRTAYTRYSRGFLHGQQL